jgi:hypothetical protein
MSWPPRRTSSQELQLQRECEVLQLKLLKANNELRTKTDYAQHLEFLVQQRSQRIDELRGKLSSQGSRSGDWIKSANTWCRWCASRRQSMPPSKLDH